MRKFLAVIIVLMMSLAMFTACGGEESSPAAIAPDVEEELYSIDFTLYNYTNADLTDIRVSMSTDTSHGENILEPGYVIPNNYSTVVSFSTGAPAGTLFDMYTNDDDGDSYEYFDIPLTEITELHLFVEWYADGSYNNTYIWY